CLASCRERQNSPQVQGIMGTVEHVDVLEIGARPTGLMMACELLRRGIAVRLVDKAGSTSEESRALGVHARTLEIFESLGIADQAVAAGLRWRNANFYANGAKIVSFTFDGLDTPYPLILSLLQSETERLLTRKLEELGGRIERGVELEQARVRKDSVEA